MSAETLSALFQEREKMNREERVNLPTVDNVLERVTDVLRDIERKKTGGILNIQAAIAQLNSLTTNLERIEGSDQLPDEVLKRAVSSVKGVKESLISFEPDTSENNASGFALSVPNGYGRGRNKFDIDVEKCQRLIQLGFSIKSIAKNGLLGGVMHPNTLYKRLKENGIQIRSSFTDVNEEELKSLISEYNRDHPNSGASEVHAYLKTQGINIKRDRCRELLSSVDTVGTALRWSTTIQRRVYSVPTANSVWHVDTHHSLIRWGFVVHGGIDGHSRLVPYLRVATCNTAKSAASFFLEGVQMYGMPSRVRADHGTEFVDVGRFMIEVNGSERGSFLTGPSVHNQRIERLWRDVFCKVLDTFYKLFLYMEERSLFNKDDPVQKWVLQYVFCPRIDMYLRQWMNTHNSHKIRTENNRTPSMLWTQSLVSADDSHTGVRNIIQPPQEAILQASRNLDILTDGGVFLKPREPCPVTRENMTNLQASVDILRRSDSHGLDIYSEVMDFVLTNQIRN